MGHFRHSKEVRDRARELVASGLTYVQAAERIGVTPVTIGRWCDPEVAARYQDRNRVQTYGPPQDKIDAIALMAAIPPDTRTLDERLNGTPLYGRRAIDRMSA